MSIESTRSPTSPIHEGITPSSSVPVLSLSWPTGWQPPNATVPDPAEKKPAKKPAQPKRKISRWILLQVWFNTYRKFFTFITLLNLAGMIMAALNRFHYAENHLGALVLGNLLLAILMRNELFLRFLYTIAIYGLRMGSIEHQVGSNFDLATRRRHPLRMRTFRRGLAGIQDCWHFKASRHSASFCDCHWRNYQHPYNYFRPERISMGSEYPS